MAANPPPRSSREDVMQFLDELDQIPTSGAPASGSTSSPSKRSSGLPATSNAEEAQSVLDFLDEITQRSSTPTAPVPPASRASLEKSASRSSLRSAAVGKEQGARSSSELSRPARTASPSIYTPMPKEKKEAPPAAAPTQPTHAASGSWGWSSMWTQASSVMEQAKKVAEENYAKQSTNLANITSQQEHAKKWMTEGVMGMVKGVDVDKLSKDLKATSLKTFTDILNAVAPPISEHEVIEVWLSHDMIGYEGVETLVYRALAKVMEQIEGGDLVVNNGSPERPNSTTDDSERNLNAVEGAQEGYKLALANLDNLIKTNPTSSKAAEPTEDLPITICPVFMRVQPVLASLPFTIDSSDDNDDKSDQQQLSFILILRDTTNKIQTQTVTQSLPASWLDIPFEENEWVENEMVDVIRKGVEVVGQNYVRTRQHGRQAMADKVKARDQAEADGALPEGQQEKAEQQEKEVEGA